MNDGDTIKNLHLHEDEETIQKTIHYLELHGRQEMPTTNTRSDF